MVMLVEHATRQFISDEELELHYHQEQEQIENMFPNCNFTIAIPLVELDTIISKEKTIILKHDWNEYYRDQNNQLKFEKRRNFYVISCDVMSVKNIIYEMIKQQVDCWGDHRFLEGITPCFEGNDTQFDLYFGS
tara:strand:+ start:578 stop:979 length:402 start_codon:yes stop_codon:yes gene_type:complete